VAGQEQGDQTGGLHPVQLRGQAQVHRSGAVVFRQDQADRGRKETAVAGKRSRGVFD